MNGKERFDLWQEDLAEDLLQFLKEIEAEVLEEYRSEIKEAIRQRIREELDRYGLRMGPSSQEGVSDCEDLSLDDFPCGPEVTVLARIFESPSGQETEVLVDSPGEDAVGRLFYTYCFTRDNQLKLDEIEGVDSGTGCFLVRGEEISAVVSLVQEEEFGETALESRFKDMEWIGRKARLHEKVIDQVMAAGPVIPLRFCTIFRSSDRVKDFLNKNSQVMLTVLGELAEVQEWGVKLYCRKDQLSKKVREGKNIQEFDLTQGTGYLKYKRLEKQCSEEMEQILDNCSREIYESLQKVSMRWVVKEPFSKEITGRQEDMIMNVIFLVPTNRVGNFCHIVEEFEEKFKEFDIIVDASGPWPPYHFVEFTPEESNE